MKTPSQRPSVLEIVLVTAIAILTVLSLTSCSDEDVKRMNAYEAPSIVNQMVFFKHPPTGLCFAYSRYDRSHTLATVPCDKVEKYLVNP